MFTAEALFERYFLPLYPLDVRDNLQKARTTNANPANNPRIIEQLNDIARVFSELAPAAFNAPDLVLDYSDASVHTLALLLNEEARNRWMNAPSDGASLLAQVVIHGAVYVGATIVKTRGAQWQVRSPLWESMVRLESKAGIADLAIFHWWIKALTDEEIGKGRLLDRYRTHVEVPTFDGMALPVIAPADRQLPRLAKVRYDLLYKHLKAHLPELKSVGDDFPSPERFEEYGFSALNFQLVGGGRMLLLWGPTKDGVHLFWLDKSGFQKAAFFQADAFPAPMVKVDGEKIKVLLSVNKKNEEVEMLWWGA
ncbi:MAG: hypothetical protein IPK82_05495 [Polyangiaceae bacterium]|nr:hypothetical protein [Polyangiaceae bacterium]